MIREVDHAFDALISLIILAIGLVIFYGCLNIIESPNGYGLGTLDEKSTKAAPAQLKKVSQLTYFSKAHAVLLPAVDSGLNTDNSNRFIVIDDIGNFSYSLNDLELGIGDRLAYVVGQIGTNSSYDRQRLYRLGITVNGDLIFSRPDAIRAGENY